MKRFSTIFLTLLTMFSTACFTAKGIGKCDLYMSTSETATSKILTLLQAEYDDHTEQGKAWTIQIVWEDTKGDPDKSFQALAEKIKNEGFLSQNESLKEAIRTLALERGWRAKEHKSFKFPGEISSHLVELILSKN